MSNTQINNFIYLRLQQQVPIQLQQKRLERLSPVKLQIEEGNWTFDSCIATLEYKLCTQVIDQLIALN